MRVDVKLSRLTVVAIAALICSSASMAQTAQPYAGLQGREIKSLSKQQIADMRAGKGMSLALAAELNGYPGPSHVLELADRLELTNEQRTRISALFSEMKNEATAIGEKIIDDETELDRLFAGSEITDKQLNEITDRIGVQQAALRRAHLRYHLTTRQILNPTQIALYTELRGYGEKGSHHPSHHHSR